MFFKKLPALTDRLLLTRFFVFSDIYLFHPVPSLPIHHENCIMDEEEYKRFVTRMYDSTVRIQDQFTYQPEGFVARAARLTEELQIEICETFEKQGFSVDDLTLQSKSPETRSKLLQKRTEEARYKKTTGSEQS